MNLVIQIILLIFGLIILIKGADLFVDGASAIALHYRISEMLVGLTIVSFGTGAPEFAIAAKSLISGSGDITMSNVIGSNIINILLIIGICATIHPLNVQSATVKKEQPILLLITTLFTLLLADHLFEEQLPAIFTRSDGIILLLFFSIFVYYIISVYHDKIDEDAKKPKMKIYIAYLITIAGIIMIIAGSNFVVESAVEIAKVLGISERVIGLTIVAIGTSLPELVTSINATRKGEYDIALGNVIGSNIFNIGIVTGLTTAIFGNINNITFNLVDLFVLMFSTVALFIYSFNDRKISRIEGLLFLITFSIYYSYIIFA